jgi:phosphatidate cytidylyltransferase
MLRTRVLTALLLLPAAYLLVFHADERTFSWVTALIVMLGSWEFRRLAGLTAGVSGWIVMALQGTLLLLAIRYWDLWTPDPIATFALLCAAWLPLFAQLFLLPAKPLPSPPPVYRLRTAVNGLVVLTGGWMALAWLRHEPEGQWWLLMLLLIIWAADTGAYFSGRAIGGAKLAPRISPGKTRAGLYGGLLTAAAVAALAAYMIPAIDAAPLPMALLAVAVAFASVGGDLFISLHKRIVGLKDTSGLIPGHGGVLDRLDSLLAGAPFFALGKLLAGF